MDIIEEIISAFPKVCLFSGGTSIEESTLNRMGPNAITGTLEMRSDS